RKKQTKKRRDLVLGFTVCVIVVCLFLQSAEYGGFGGSGFAASWWSDSMDWYSPDWRCCKRLTVDSTQVSGDLYNFQVLVSVTDPDLASSAQLDGDDILFTSIDGTKLDHEVEKYTGATGELVAWVQVPFLSSSLDTEFLMYYGNPESSSQENPNGVWSSGGFVGVWHLEDGADSSSYGNDGAVYGATQTEGQVDGAYSFDGTDDYVIVSNANDIDSPSFSVLAWVNSSSVQGGILWQGSYYPAYSLYFSDNQQLQTIIEANGGRGTISSFTVDAGEMTLVGLVFDAENEQISFIKNDLIENKGWWGFQHSVYAGNLYLGRQLQSNEYFSGVIDEVRIYDCAISQDYLSTFYSNLDSPSAFISFSSEYDVTSDNTAPTLSSFSFQPEVPELGDTVYFSVRASDDVMLSNVTLEVTAQYSSLDKTTNTVLMNYEGEGGDTYTYSVAYNTICNVSVVAVAWDAAGNSVNETAAFCVGAPVTVIDRTLTQTETQIVYEVPRGNTVFDIIVSSPSSSWFFGAKETVTVRFINKEMCWDEVQATLWLVDQQGAPTFMLARDTFQLGGGTSQVISPVSVPFGWGDYKLMLEVHEEYSGDDYQVVGQTISLVPVPVELLYVLCGVVFVLVVVLLSKKQRHKKRGSQRKK
ncbi:MAG: DUF2341 domain-containing protein, partial [archaeon]